MQIMDSGSANRASQTVNLTPKTARQKDPRLIIGDFRITLP